MTPDDDSLAHLIAREQRGFRRVLYAGLATLLVMVLTSAALGAYLYVAAESLSETTRTLQRQAFDTRRAVDAQNNRLVAQEIAIRRAYEEIRGAIGRVELAEGDYDASTTLAAAGDFLLRGRLPSLAAERALSQLAPSDAALDPATRNFLRGVAALVMYESRGDAIDDPNNLPAAIASAASNFEVAVAEPALQQVANAGMAWIAFEVAQADNYSRAACERVFDAVSASVQDDVPSPQPLYWRAQCERKLGLTADAMADYALALRASADVGVENRDAAEQLIAMNAFHGVGTTLIAGADIPDANPAVSAALGIAKDACPNGDSYAGRSPRMALALACLDEAIALRRALGQTPNQLSGSAENISFAHLRDGDFNAAFEHTMQVERTGLFAWNEVARALAASRTQYEDPVLAASAAAAAVDARRNVSMFTVGQFNLCELQVLFDEDMYEAARLIIAEAHPSENVACNKSA